MSDYRKTKERQYAVKLDSMIENLPLFCEDFFRVRRNALSASTMVKYATDYYGFFEWVLDNIPDIKADTIKEITISDMELINETDLGDFITHTRYYTVRNKCGDYIEAAKSTVEGKSISVCNLFHFLTETGRIKRDPTLVIKHPAIRKNKNIIFLDFEEQMDLIRCVDKGTGIPETQKRFWKKNRLRDLAIICTFLDTGMRVSELAGIDLRDILFKTHKIEITRKGGKEDWVPISDFAEQAIKDYLIIREKEYKPEENETALFLSSHHKRMSVRNLEILVTKYADIAIPQKKITPHKLRSTYATSLIRLTGDIYMVAENLGHSSLNTTKIYAEATEEYRAKSRNLINEKRGTN